LLADTIDSIGGITMLTFFIIDDDAVSRRMLQSIVEDSGLGEVIGLADNGMEGVAEILRVMPDVVLIDLLMGDQDGIESMSQLRDRGFPGKFVMISQVVDKEMVGQAYQMGIEFFIHKPINKLEIQAVLEKVNGQLMLDRSLLEIRKSLAFLEQDEAFAKPVVKEWTVRDAAYQMMMDMGITGESGSKEIVAIMDYLVDRQERELPPLQELYEAIAAKYKRRGKEIAKESKAIEQRLRRTVLVALSHLASLGLTDYSNPKFEYYAPTFFDFQEVRLRMKEMDEENPASRGKVSVKKFLQSFYWELSRKLNG
jgi:two-component system response regulator YcbB